ncbi:hypothetical protein [Pedobacter jeongneungensis]|uniref:hypothetical protein n=1 Tax=Pedobacter jeongneungensis TaxID=947309 RepID=UPI00046A5426|nr:hypothetical protein [Pedobacter jeongneungensis]
MKTPDNDLFGKTFFTAKLKDSDDWICGFYTRDKDENRSPAIINPDDGAVHHIKRETLEMYIGGDNFMKM